MKKTQVSMHLRIGLIATGLAAIGVALGFFGWYLIDSQGLVRLGLFLTIAGVIVGFASIIIGQIVHGRNAIAGGIEAMKDLGKR